MWGHFVHTLARAKHVKVDINRGVLPTTIYIMVSTRYGFPISNEIPKANKVGLGLG